MSQREYPVGTTLGEKWAFAVMARLVVALAKTKPRRYGPGKELRELIERARRILGEAGFRYCNGCGCSDNDACAGGCSWIRDDCCSSCAPHAPRL
jgi:hypothetical protein